MWGHPYITWTVEGRGGQTNDHFTAYALFFKSDHEGGGIPKFFTTCIMNGPCVAEYVDGKWAL